MKMENYYWCSYDHKRVVIPEEGVPYCLGGEGYGRQGFKDGTRIQTSSIVTVENGVATTRSGSVYELGSMHPDYVEILSAIEEGTPVIKEWSLEGNLRDGYILTGHVHVDVVLVSRKVTSQEGNFITIDDTRYLVIWRNLNMNPMDKFTMMITGKYCDLHVNRDFSEYMQASCIRPNLMK